ncbi:MAG: M23 family metallopeptidase [Propionibacteriales bacterium]|nr:M23 family metallopeptidase [Propionibacteriales bacterium]
MSSPAPKRRLDVRQQTPRDSVGGRRAAVRPRRRKTSLRFTPAAAGAVALVMAGIGAAALSPRADQGSLDSGYQTISASYTGAQGVDVTPEIDEATLARQTEQQASQKLKVDGELRDKAQNVADEYKSNQWVLPVTGYALTARFGQSSSLWARVHTGLDFAGPSGSTIVSVAAGTVTDTSYAGAYGNRTVVTLDDGTEIWYCHQSRIVATPGERVRAGQTIGYTGSTGNVTGPHLHLEVRPGGGEPIDPEIALREHGVTP